MASHAAVPSAFEAHAVDIPAADIEEFAGGSSLSRRSARWDRRMFRQPSSVIVIRSDAGPQPAGDGDGDAAAGDGSAATPLLVSR